GCGAGVVAGQQSRCGAGECGQFGNIDRLRQVVRQHGNGFVRVDDTKTDAGKRTIPLPPFAVTVLTERRKRPFIGEQSVIFASTTGTLRDPDNFGKQWRQAREDLGVPDIHP
ncbi:MAG: hypothetical protein QOK09_3500, partial [Mycobacterium sp.]|nr:hypothetical protein [Mycobacterium sp.]